MTPDIVGTAHGKRPSFTDGNHKVFHGWLMSTMSFMDANHKASGYQTIHHVINTLVSHTHSHSLVCRMSYVVCRVSCVVCRMSYVVCRVSCVVCRVSCVVCRMSCVVGRMSHVVCRHPAHTRRGFVALHVCDMTYYYVP